MDAPEPPYAADASWSYSLDRTEVDIDETLVRRLLATQFPALSRAALELLGPWGTDNAMFRLGREFVVRLPRRGWAKDGVAKEARWLPELATHLTVPVPEVVRVGTPSDDYPWTWAVYRWLPGERPSIGSSMDRRAFAEQLGSFLAALHGVRLEGGPAPGPHNGFRGGPAAARDRWVRPSIEFGDHGYDRKELMAFWDDAVARRAPTSTLHWVHGDLTPNNLLVRDRSLTAVIDWGCLAVGDPACDLMIAWNLDDQERAALRERFPVDDATWARGRAAAFWQWIGSVTEAEPDNEARRVIDRALADYRATG